MEHVKPRLLHHLLAPQRNVIILMGVWFFCISFFTCMMSHKHHPDSCLQRWGRWLSCLVSLGNEETQLTTMTVWIPGWVASLHNLMSNLTTDDHDPYSMAGDLQPLKMNVLWGRERTESLSVFINIIWHPQRNLEHHLIRNQIHSYFHSQASQGLPQTEK